MCCESVLDVLTGSVTVLTMAVTHCKQVHTLGLAHIGRQGVAILVHLVWILGLVAAGGRKCKLGNYVEPCLLILPLL